MSTSKNDRAMINNFVLNVNKTLKEPVGQRSIETSNESSNTTANQLDLIREKKETQTNKFIGLIGAKGIKLRK